MKYVAQSSAKFIRRFIRSTVHVVEFCRNNCQSKVIITQNSMTCRILKLKFWSFAVKNIAESKALKNIFMNMNGQKSFEF